MIELDRKKVLVVGLGMSGAAAAKVTARLGASVDVVDSSNAPLKAGMVEELESSGVKVSLGVSAPVGIGGYDLLVASPGVPDGAPVLMRAREAGVRVMSELELGFRLLEGRTIIAVTGTNGKTTTTRLIGEMLSRERRALTCGNIGNPLVGLFEEAGPDDVLVVEVSSFQLKNIEKFRANVGVVLNIAPDHFDWHRDFEDYREAKMRLVENMLPGDFLVYNLEDESCRMMASRARGQTLGFSAASSPESAIWLEEDWIVAGSPLQAGGVMPVAELKLAGAHNVLNVMAAAAAALAIGVRPEELRVAAGGFEGLEHRMEFVAMVNGVAFYNDSKATNPHATLHAVRSLSQPVVAIMGGRNKGLDFTEVAREVCVRIRDGRMKGLVLLGESAQEIKAAVKLACGDKADGHLLIVGDLDESVSSAYALTGGSGAVLFTPACASFDMFEDYADRGRAFKDSVARFKESGAGASGK